MPKHDKKKKNSTKGTSQINIKPLNIAEEEGQTYGMVEKTLGDRHFTVSCQDGKTRRCKVRGKMKNRQWVKDGDIVLVTMRDFDDDEGDIVDVYSGDQVRVLRRNGELTIGANDQGEVMNNVNEVVFEDPFDFGKI